MTRKDGRMFFVDGRTWQQRAEVKTGVHDTEVDSIIGWTSKSITGQ